MWNAEELLDATAGALRGLESRLSLEQAVYGMDAKDEVELHAEVAAGFLAAGFGVHREQPYPGEWRRKKGRRRELPEGPERLRCDLVLAAADGAVEIADPLKAARGAEEARAAAAGTLFEGRVGEEVSAPSTGIDPSAAYWLELKVVGQHSYRAGVPGPNRTYTSELLRGPTRDLTKLCNDREIVNGGVMVLHFGADERIASHDLARLMERCLDRELPIRSPSRRVVPIADRIGNAVATVLLIELSNQGREPSATDARVHRSRAGYPMSARR
ncbi:MAG: hypothetical protein JNM07_00330 [Phycisphaerae bacterium]|nr:hypothetical protein [Phycisphaerae bacterium]